MKKAIECEEQRNLYREIKDMTGSYSSICGAMTLSRGKVLTEGKEVTGIWQQYTKELYRRVPNATLLQRKHDGDRNEGGDQTHI